MDRKIISRAYYLLYMIFLTLTVSMLTAGQTPEKAIDSQTQINYKTFAAGHRISGIVTTKSDSEPVAKAKIEIRGINTPAAGAQFFTSQTITDEQGRWTINQVPDDNYVILISPARTLTIADDKSEQTNEINSVAGTKFVSQTREVKISGTDIDNLAIQVIKGGRITGKVIMDGGESLPKDLIVLPEQTIKDGRSPIRSALVQPDGSFVLKNVPTGNIVIKAGVYGKPKEYYMKTASSNGIDLLRATLNIEDGSEVKDVQIILAKVADK